MKGLKKTIHIRSDAMKEMEAWANVGHEGQKLGRNSGQLPDNVTEERMLHTRLWELSKERYKFLSQAEYEKKMFLERQQRKSAAMKEIIERIQVSGRRSAASKQRSRMSVGQATPSPRPKITAPSSAKIERVQPTNSDVSPRPKSTPSWSIRPSEAPTEPGPTSPLSKTVPVFPTEPNIVKKGSHRRVQIISRRNSVDNTPVPSPREKLPLIQIQPPTNVKFVTRHESDKGSKPGSPRQHGQVRKGFKASTKSILKWTCGKPKDEPAVVNEPAVRKGPMADPRYVHLESCLSDYYKPKDVELKEIPLIIRTMECLHKPPNVIKDTKPKLTLKIREFMTDHGIAF